MAASVSIYLETERNKLFFSFYFGLIHKGSKGGGKNSFIAPSRKTWVWSGLYTCRGKNETLCHVWWAVPPPNTSKWCYIFNVKGGSVEGTYHLPGVCQMPSAATHVKKTIVLSLPLYLLLLLWSVLSAGVDWPYNAFSGLYWRHVNKDITRLLIKRNNN